MSSKHQNTIESPLTLYYDWKYAMPVPGVLTLEERDYELVDLAYAKELQKNLEIVTDWHSSAVKQFNKVVAKNTKLQATIDLYTNLLVDYKTLLEKTGNKELAESVSNILKERK